MRHDGRGGGSGNGKNFWGCDINPVATLIARVKTRHYRDAVLERFDAVRDEFDRNRFPTPGPRVRIRTQDFLASAEPGRRADLIVTSYGRACSAISEEF